MLRNAYEDVPHPDTVAPTDGGPTGTIADIINQSGNRDAGDTADLPGSVSGSDETDASKVPEWFKPQLPVDAKGRILPPESGDPRYNADGTIKHQWLDPELTPLWSFEQVGWDSKNR